MRGPTWPKESQVERVLTGRSGREAQGLQNAVEPFPQNLRRLGPEILTTSQIPQSTY